jgi:hypothetical protein
MVLSVKSSVPELCEDETGRGKGGRELGTSLGTWRAYRSRAQNKRRDASCWVMLAQTLSIPRTNCP